MVAHDVLNLDDIDPAMMTSFLDDVVSGDEREASLLLSLRMVAEHESRWVKESRLHEFLEAYVIESIRFHRGMMGAHYAGQHDMAALLEGINQDFSVDSPALERWSAVYFRFFFPVSCSILSLCQKTGVNKRRFHRRLQAGLNLLIRALVEAESHARRATQFTHLYAALPTASYDLLLEREALLDGLLGLFKRDTSRHVISLEGIAGCGKTAVAHKFAKELIDEGLVTDVVWLDAVHIVQTVAGDAQTSLTAIVAEIFRKLGILGDPEDTEALQHIKQVLFGRHCLFVVDGVSALADYADVIRGLYPLSYLASFLYTSHISLAQFPYIQIVKIGGLTEEGSLSLYESVANRYHENASIPAKIRPFLYEKTGGVPSLLKIIAEVHFSVLSTLNVDENPLGDMFSFKMPMEEYCRGLMAFLDGPATKLLVVFAATTSPHVDASWLLFLSGMTADAFGSAMQALVDAHIVRKHVERGGLKLSLFPPGMHDALKAQPEFMTLFHGVIEKGLARLLGGDLPNDIETLHALFLEYSDDILALLSRGQQDPTLDLLTSQCVVALHPTPQYEGYWEAWSSLMTFAAAVFESHKMADPLVTLLMGIAYQQFYGGQWDLAEVACQRIIKVSDGADHAIAMAQAYYLLVESLLFRERITDAQQAMQRAWSQVTASPNHDDYRKAQSVLKLADANILRFEGDNRGALAASLDAESLVEDIPANKLGTILADIYQDQGLYYWLNKIYDHALLRLHVASEIVYDAGDAFKESYVYGNLGLVYWSMAQFEEAQQHMEHSLYVARKLQAGWASVSKIGNLVLVIFYRGELEQALSRVAEHVTLAAQYASDREQRRALINQSVIQYHLGQLDDALHGLQLAYHQMQIQQTTLEAKVCAMVYLCRCYSRLGQDAALSQMLDNLVELQQSGVTEAIQLLILRCRAEQSSGLEARELLQEALLLSESRPFDKAACLLGLAQSEEVPAQMDAWQEGVAIMQRIGCSTWLDYHPNDLPLLI